MAGSEIQSGLKIHWPAVLLWLFAIALSAAASWASLEEELEERAFRRYGKTTLARVTSFDDRNRRDNYYCEYAFSALDPSTGKDSTYTGYGKMVDENRSRARDRRPVFIVYNAGAPRDNRPRDYDVSNQAGLAILFAAFGLLLAWHLCRDLLRYRRFLKNDNPEFDVDATPFVYDPDARPEDKNPYGY
jgi:hypothetical protein